MANAKLAWNLISSENIRINDETKETFNDQYILQLKGIFISLDINKTNSLTKSQVIEALKLLGLNENSDLIKMFFKNKSNITIDFNDFVEILYKEKKRIKNINSEFDSLFLFLDPDNTGTVSVNRLKNLLTSNNKLGLTKDEFSKFLISTNIHEDNEISISKLKKELIVS